MPSAHNPLGVFSMVYGPVDVGELGRRAAADGFTHVHLEARAHGIPGPDGHVTAERARAAQEALAAHGVTIAALAAYTNLVDPDPARRETGLRRFEEIASVARAFGSPHVATETGSLHPESTWRDHPANHTPAAQAELRTVLGRLIAAARTHGATVLIEGYVNNVVATTDEAAALVTEFGSEHLGFVLDPFNYCTREDVVHPRAALERIFAAIARHAPIAHAKDVVYGADGIDTPKVGDGRMDWPAFAAMLRRHCPTVPLVLEHLTPADIPQCRALVEQAFAQA